jgi:AcrR family transcriptional regulator
MIVAEGYHNLSLRKVARRINYAPSTIYLYFPDKFSVVAAIATSVFERLTARLEHAKRETEHTPLEALQAGLRCYIEFGLANRKPYMVTFGMDWPEEHKTNPAGAGPVEAGLRAFGHLKRAIQACMDSGYLEPGDAFVVAQSAWAAVHGLVSLLIVSGEASLFPIAPWEALIHHTIETIIRGNTPKGILTQHGG